MINMQLPKVMWWVDLRSILCCFATSHAMCTRWSNCDSLCLQEWCYSSVPVKTTSPCWSWYFISVVPRQHMSVPWTDDILNVPTIKLQNNVNLSPNTFAGLHFHIYLCLHAGVYVYIYIFMCMYVCMHVCIRVCIHVFLALYNLRSSLKPCVAWFVMGDYGWFGSCDIRCCARRPVSMQSLRIKTRRLNRGMAPNYWLAFSPGIGQNPLHPREHSWQMDVPPKKVYRMV